MVKKNNGKVFPGVVEIVLMSGVRVHVMPLSPWANQGALERARSLHPLPDPDDYRYQPPDQKSPDAAYPADSPHNPRHEEYQQAVETARREQNLTYLRAIVDLCVTFPDFDGRDAVIAYFADRREQMAQYMDLPDDDWLATWRYCVITHQDDHQQITDIALGNIDMQPISPDEVADGYRRFRPVLRGKTVERLARLETLASRIEGSQKQTGDA